MSAEFFTPCCSNDCLCTLSSLNDKKPLFGVIYAGHHDVAFTVYTAPDLKHIAGAEKEITIYKPQQGWYEQDAEEIMDAINNCCERACNNIISLGYKSSDIEAIGITNQRETVVAWHNLTGKPLYRAIASNDSRAADIAEKIVSNLQDQYYYRSISGLPILPIFFALKVRWLQDNVDDVKKAIKDGNCKVGTLDSWIVWNLTKGGLHITDVTNASYTLLMNINNVEWDKQLLKTFSIKKSILPEIRCNSEINGLITNELSVLRNINIRCIIADQPAILMSKMYSQTPKISVDLSSNCCLICNVEKNCVCTQYGITTIAYKFDSDSKCIYALEGTTCGCGKIFEWLQGQLHVFPLTNFTEEFPKRIRSTENLYFVPAFNGLNAPYWNKNARGIFIGLTDKTTRTHIVLAAFEAICFQIYDVLESMRSVGEIKQDSLYVSGQYAYNDYLMQMLSNISGMMVIRFSAFNPVSYGTAICIGRSIDAIDMKCIKQGIWRNSMDFATFTPLTKIEQRMNKYTKWRRAIALSMNWTNDVEKKANDKNKLFLLYRDKKNIIIDSAVAGVILLTAMAHIIHFFSII